MFGTDPQTWRERARALVAAIERRGTPTRASFDPVRVEDELYDALYGVRTGTVENIAPLRPKQSREPGRVRRGRGDHPDSAPRSTRGAAGRS